MDERRASDLDELRSAVDEYWRGRHALPPSIAALVEQQGPYLRTRQSDPATGRLYEYRLIDGSRFELCAVFDTEEVDSERRNADDWHPAGRSCHTFAPRP